ncbi:MAG: (2Fe-2S)-binding protein [Burkholderiaceae bacterium]|nr:(2Fe-2S)-binding protein [Burkholderiaceae bacterium]
MIVCICRAVSDRQIQAVVSRGASSMSQVRAELGAGECCGKCTRQVRELIDQHAHASRSCDGGGHCACA